LNPGRLCLAATASAMGEFGVEHSGFHVIVFSAGDLEMAAVSDVDPARLAELVDVIRRAQTKDASQRR
jgi:hypothetical protein